MIKITREVSRAEYLKITLVATCVNLNLGQPLEQALESNPVLLELKEQLEPSRRLYTLECAYWSLPSDLRSILIKEEDIKKLITLPSAASAVRTKTTNFFDVFEYTEDQLLKELTK